jgi:hypothetical protein
MNMLILATALVIAPEEQAVFAGRQTIRVTLRNPTDQLVETEVSTRVLQATTATVVPVGDAQPWKTLRVLPGQTVIETATLTFPAVRAPTRFLVQWGELGRTTVMVYPQDFLKGLSKLAGDQPLGVFDPGNLLKPVLRRAGVKFADFEIETEDCRLMLVWTTRKEVPAPKGTNLVWIRPEEVAYLHDGTMFVTETSMADLATNPVTQRALVRFAELVLTKGTP